MSEFLVAPLYKNSNRPWRQRRSQGIHNALGAIQFIEADNREEAAKKIAIRTEFMFDKSQTYIVIPMRGAEFFDLTAPTVTITPGTPEGETT